MIRFTAVGMMAALLLFIQCAGACLIAPLREVPAAETTPPCHPQKPAGESPESCGHGTIDVDQPLRGFADPWTAGPAPAVATATAPPSAACPEDFFAFPQPAAARRASPPLRI